MVPTPSLWKHDAKKIDGDCNCKQTSEIFGDSTTTTTNGEKGPIPGVRFDFSLAWSGDSESAAEQEKQKSVPPLLD